jgi:signal transduction histidine kinase
MSAVRRRLLDPDTYRHLIYLGSAVPLGLTWFVALLTVSSLCLGLAVTPLVIPLLFVLAAMTRGFAALEAELARALLGVDAVPPGWPPGGGGIWSRVRHLFGPGFWRAQEYLLMRSLLGFPVGVAVLGLLVGAAGLLTAPLWLPLTRGGLDLGIWSPRSLLQSLALMPIGVVLLPAGLLAVNPLASLFAPIAAALLSNRDPREDHSTGVKLNLSPRRALSTHAVLSAIVLLPLLAIWAITSRGYFWPIWIVLPLGLALAIHGWSALVDDHPALVARFLGSRTLAAGTGVGIAIAVFFLAIWGITGHGYFWPVWPILAIAVVLAVEVVSVLVSSPDRVEMEERIETLESTRAGAVDAQDAELRRIERDLHDGAQARLVAIGMSLGMAEQRLAEDPARAGELLAEARAGAEHALRELRDLARGIHPPVLADRGLEAALLSLANATPLTVELSVALTERPPPVVETAAYFVAAEALANAAKHARATRVGIRITQTDHALEVEVSDDGVGGADPDGAGLLGLRQRVAALDGALIVSSPPGGPTKIHAELPCA